MSSGSAAHAEDLQVVMHSRSVFEIFPELRRYRAADYARLRVTKPTIAVAMTARTGSTHLADALARALGTASPLEIFNPRGPIYLALRRLAASGELPAGDGGKAVSRDTAGADLLASATFPAYIAGLTGGFDDVFVFKTSWRDFGFLAPFYRHLFPAIRFVYLDRRDTLAQAVSLFRAMVTGHWHAPKGASGPRQTPADLYDLGRLAGLFGRLQSQKADWEHFFRANGILPLRLDYEDFSRNLAGALAAIADACGTPLRHADVDSSQYEKIADPTVRLWTERLRRDLAPDADAVAARRAGPNSG